MNVRRHRETEGAHRSRHRYVERSDPRRVALPDVFVKYVPAEEGGANDPSRPAPRHSHLDRRSPTRELAEENADGEIHAADKQCDPHVSRFHSRIWISG